MPSSTTTLLNTIEWAKRFNFGREFAFGNSLEPALTSANMVLQTTLGPPFSWRWNRVITGFVTTAGIQDYTLINWAATTAQKINWYVVDSNGNSQQVTTAGTTGGSPPSWNNTLNATTNDGSVVWTNRGSLAADLPISQTYSLNWIETTSVKDTTKWYEIESKINLGLDSSQARPKFISAQMDDGLGNITFRLTPVPDTIYPTVITLQQKPPLFTSTNQTWSPIPDEFSHVYSWGFLSMMWMFADDSRFPFANQKFVSHLLSAQEGLTQTEINIFLNNWQYITGQSIEKSNAISQGFQARGM
jgi:hypothetical protein